jgi:superfamily II DNA or RNA helicase
MKRLARLKGIAGFELSESTTRSFARLARRKATIFSTSAYAQAAEAVESLVGEVLDALLLFITEHLKLGAEEYELMVFDEAQVMIADEIDRINTLVTARRARRCRNRIVVSTALGS